MRHRTVLLAGSTPGTQRSLTVLSFGTPNARPRCYLQAGLHADEVPGMLVAQRLRTRLAALEAAGRLIGEIVLVPCANPIGLSQHVSGSHIGRFALGDGSNFNRGFPALFEKIVDDLGPALGDDAVANSATVRAALAAALDALPAVTEHQALKHALLREAVGADVVLDLHCDTEAVVHLYTGTPLVDDGRRLAALLGARALLVAELSGDDPFDEACSRPWWECARRFPERRFATRCFAATVELRGAADVAYATAAADTEALLDFLRGSGAIDGAVVVPPLQCDPTPLRGSEPIVASRSGVVVFHRDVGERVAAGDAIADLVDPIDGTVATLTTPTAGLLYARCATRWAWPGMRLAKVAGSHATRHGRLLSP